MQNGTDVEQFYYVPNDVTVQVAIRKYRAYLEWRTGHFIRNESVPKKVQIRVSSENALAGCDDFYYKHCLTAGMHIVMYTGPYTLQDVTEGREYKVTVKTVNDKNQCGETVGTWWFE